MKRILITGGLGYIGTELCKVLLSNGYKNIIVIDNKFNSERVSFLIANGVKFFERDLFDIKDLLKESDICYHLAGITDVPQTRTQSTPEKDKEIIRIGTDVTRYIIENLPQFCKIVFMSTQVVYDGLKEPMFNLKEDFEPCPIVAYSISKWQSERDLLYSNKTNYLIIRLASVYGHNESVRWKILPNLFSKLTAQDKNLKVFGANNIKPFVSVRDVANCLEFLVRNEYNKEIFHCVNENLSVIEVANICQQFNPKINIEIINEPTPNQGFSLSNDKLLKTGFKFYRSIENEMSNMIEKWSNKCI